MSAAKELQLSRHLKQDRHLWAHMLQRSFRDETLLSATIKKGTNQLIVLQGLYTATNRNMRFLFTLSQVIQTLLLRICSASDACMLPGMCTKRASTVYNCRRRHYSTQSVVLSY